MDRSIALLDKLNAEGNAWARSLLRATREKGDSQSFLLALVASAVQAPVSLATAAYRLTRRQPHPMTLHAHIDSFALCASGLEIPTPLLIALFRTTLNHASASSTTWESASASIDDAYALASRLGSKPLTRQPQETVAAIVTPKAALKKVAKPKEQGAQPTPQVTSPPTPPTALRHTCCVIHQGPPVSHDGTVATIDQAPDVPFIRVDRNNPVLTEEQERLVESLTRDEHPPIWMTVAGRSQVRRYPGPPRRSLRRSLLRA